MVEFKILEGKLGISISGGTDSSLVLYLLMKQYSGHITVFNTVWHERLNHVECVHNVYNKCIELTGHTDSELIETPINETYSEYNLFNTPLEYLRSSKVDYVYSGLTANPPVELKHSDTKIQKRDNRRENLIDDNNFYLPFANENKQKISELYHKYNLIESLFPITFSCVLSTTSRHCDNCWWCEERKWGFGKL